MKRHLLLAITILLAVAGMAQEKCYWVFFTDKNDTQFDPYTYFDAKAIERYRQCGADLYDVSNYPLNDNYVNTVDGYAIEVFGESRWLNAIGVITSDDNALLISTLPFVERIQEIVSFGTMASVESPLLPPARNDEVDVLTDQLIRFGGHCFHDKGIDGKGLRICVMDGGFPAVDTHPAFKHLRDNHQILMTYNFANKIENVYGWSDHGTCVLSCIAGINNKGQKLGLATGAEFILARTEVDQEPFKEEVWWAQGAEWADKNGADIINSSLGYGKDRHWTKDLDGTSYVAKAAQKAAEKGILICNAAGNEGDDKHWMTIITPADAEDVLTVGGIEADLEVYRHIYFSSYGPTADKRLKPNVVAFGEAEFAETKKGGFSITAGTSISAPLVTGFAACAWQTRRDLTALQMKAEIEKSADLYPYFDYAFGYGVPQAAYFTNELKPAERSFQLSQEKDGVLIRFTRFEEGQSAFLNIEGADGVLIGYYKVYPDPTGVFLNNSDLGQGRKLNVSYLGFYDSCPVNGTGDKANLAVNERFYGNDDTFQKVKREGWQKSLFLDFDYNFGNANWSGFNRHTGFGYRLMYGKSYKLGLGIRLDFNRYVNKNNGINDKTIMKNMQIRSELFQRILIRELGINWDLGVYGGINATRRVKTINSTTWAETPHPYSDQIINIYNNSKNMNLFEYGVTTRISYSLQNTLNIGLYGSYRLSNINMKKDPIIGDPNQPSPWSIGIELEIAP